MSAATLRRRLKALATDVAALRRRVSPPESRRYDEHRDANDSLLAAWRAGGCKPPLPLPGPRPFKYTDAEWQQIYRRACGLASHRKGLPLPDDFSDAERAEIATGIAHFAEIDPEGTTFGLTTMSELHPYLKFLKLVDEGIQERETRATTTTPAAIAVATPAPPTIF